MKQLQWLIILLVFSVFQVNGQIEDLEEDLRTQPEDTLLGWKFGGSFGLTFSQVSFTNWVAGGENSISGIGELKLFLDYTGEKDHWASILEFGYGIQRLGEKNTKTDDRIYFSTKYGRHIAKSWYAAALIDFKTQMAPGYTSDDARLKTSNWMSPAYLFAALGFDLIAGDYMSLYLAPVTNKTTFVLDQELADSGSYGLDPGQTTRAEFGGYIKFNFKYEILKNVTFQTRLDLFSNYLNNPQNIDVDWEVLLDFKVNKFLSAKINTNLIYDDDIMIGEDTTGDGLIDRTGPRVQFKEIFGLSISVNF